MTHVGDEPEPGVVDGGRTAAGWDLDDGGAVAFEVEDARHVDGVGVPGEEQRVRVQQSVEDADLVAVRDADVLHPDAHRLQRRGRHAVEERLDAPDEVEVVEEQVGRLLGREAVVELEGADAGLDPVRGEDLGRHGVL